MSVNGEAIGALAPPERSVGDRCFIWEVAFPNLLFPDYTLPYILRFQCFDGAAFANVQVEFI